MNENSQRQHLLFTELVSRFEEAVRERESAVRRGWDLGHLRDSPTVQGLRCKAREDLGVNSERVERLRAGLIDAFTVQLNEAENNGLTSDQSIAIGEHAFRAGFAACWKAADVPYHVPHAGEEALAIEQAWGEYDPPEELKGL